MRMANAGCVSAGAGRTSEKRETVRELCDCAVNKSVDGRADPAAMLSSTAGPRLVLAKPSPSYCPGPCPRASECVAFRPISGLHRRAATATDSGLFELFLRENGSGPQWIRTTDTRRRGIGASNARVLPATPPRVSVLGGTTWVEIAAAALYE